MDLADLMKTEMDRRGWTLNQTAEQCRLAPSHISRIINRAGEEPRMETLAKISNTLGIPFLRLVEACGYPTFDYSHFNNDEIAMLRLWMLIPEFHEMAKVFTNLSHSKRMALIEIAKVLENGN